MNEQAEKIPTRDGFGRALVELGKENKNIVVVSADLEDSTRAEWFKKEFPERHFSCGIAEQDMVSMGAGFTFQGYIPFINSFAVFLTNRAYDQIRIDLCYNKRNVKIICTHTGVTVGEDGATAQSLEDVAIMRALPNMKVVVPVDAVQAAKFTRIFAETEGPMYMRNGRGAFPIVTDPDHDIELGKAQLMRKGQDVTIIACGIMVSEALSAAEKLAKEDIEARVLNMHTIKPIDVEAIRAAAEETGAIVTAEEHQIHGGLGSAVAEVLTRNVPVPQEMIAVKDSFGCSGKPEELLKHFNLKDTDIVAAAKLAIKRRMKMGAVSSK